MGIGIYAEFHGSGTISYREGEESCHFLVQGDLPYLHFIKIFKSWYGSSEYSYELAKISKILSLKIVDKS